MMPELTTSFEEPAIREDILHRMRDMARRGTNVRELVRFVQGKLGVNEAVYLPVLGYLTRAFGLHLREVLPVREWIGSDYDDEINAALIPAIERNRPYWLPLIPQDPAVPK